MSLAAAWRARAARRRRVLVLAVLCPGALLLGLGVGAVEVPPARAAAVLLDALAAAGDPARRQALLEGDPLARILLQIRLPRVVLAALVGASLGAAGAAFQGMFRNPMADPYVIGVSSGASLGAVLALHLSGRLPLPAAVAVPLFAFAAGVAAVVLVYAAARSAGRVPVTALLLSGIAVASFFGSLVALVVSLSGERLRPIVFWLLGGLSGASWRDVGMLLPYAAAGLAVLWRHGRELNALLLGEEPAHHLGVDPERVKRRVVAAGALLTAAAVSVSGVIGFVGLIVPHAVRWLTGPDHRLLIPATALVGAMWLVACDALARTLAAPLELPVGVVTAMAGGPFFLVLLRRRLRALRAL